jgi:hypothetical protein
MQEEETKEQLLTDQGKENPDSPKKKKSSKSHNRIRRLKQENKLLKRRFKRIQVLK